MYQNEEEINENWYMVEREHGCIKIAEGNMLIQENLYMLVGKEACIKNTKSNMPI